MRIVLRLVLLPGSLTVVAAIVAGVLLGPAVALALLMLVALEVAMAADSSVPMAGVAGRIDSPARRVFLSLGLVAAVVVTRLLLPPLAVAAEDGDARDALVDAVAAPRVFAAELLEVRPAIAAFGAVFVWMVFCEYLFNTDRLPRRPWMGSAEAALARVRHPWLAAWTTAAAGTALVAALAVPALVPTVLIAAVAGAAAYACSKLVGAWARRRPGRMRGHVHAATVILERALVIFLVFEILDGVSTLQALPLVPAPVVQALVAGTAVVVGAVFLASLTSGVVAADALARLRHLKAGAAYVLGVLAVLLWVSLVVPVPGAVAAWAGSLVIGAALLSSLRPRVRWRAARAARRVPRGADARTRA